MSTKIRLSRTGTKKKPFYHLVVANSASPRDGKFIEVVGTHNPFAKDIAERLKVKAERISYWLSTGAQPSDKVVKLLIGTGFDVPEKFVKEIERQKAKPKKPSKKEAKAA